MIAPFIEVPILDNADQLEELLSEFEYDDTIIYATVVQDDEGVSFEGFVAEIHLFADDELVAVTTTWANKNDLLQFMKQAISEDFQIE